MVRVSPPPRAGAYQSRHVRRHSPYVCGELSGRDLAAAFCLRRRVYLVYSTIHRHCRWIRLAWPNGQRRMEKIERRDVTKAPGAASKGTRLLGCLLRADPQVYERVAPVPLYPVVPAKAYISSLPLSRVPSFVRKYRFLIKPSGSAGS